MEVFKIVGRDENGRLIYKGKQGGYYQRFDIEEDAIFINLPLPRDYCPCFELLFPFDFIIKRINYNNIGDRMVRLSFLGVFDNIEGGKREIYVDEEGKYYYKVYRNEEEHFYLIRNTKEIEYINMHLNFIKSDKNKNIKKREEN